MDNVLIDLDTFYYDLFYIITEWRNNVLSSRLDFKADTNIDKFN
jgi:hypothetical protein